MQKILSCFFLVLVITSCAGKKETVTATNSIPAFPYQTIRPTDTATLLPPLTKFLLPTATVSTYIVLAGDSLTSIAAKYGVTLEALKDANPDLQTSTLQVGTKLIIPFSNEITGVPKSTPAILSAQKAHCWTETDGGLWCFALIQNEYAEAIENLSAQFSLLDPEGQEFASQTAFALLDVIPAGHSMALGVHFPAPIQSQTALRVQTLTAIRLLPSDTRYLPTEIDNTLIELDANKRKAQVSGKVILTSEGTANVLWVLATAYNKAGEVVGMRRWNSPSALKIVSPASFNFSVYSMGAEIDRVELLAEAKP